MKSHADVAQHEKYTSAYPTSADARAAVVSHSVLLIHLFSRSCVVSYCYSPEAVDAELRSLSLRAAAVKTCPLRYDLHLIHSLI